VVAQEKSALEAYGMLFFTWLKQVVSGECCRKSFQNGQPFIVIFAYGSKQGRGGDYTIHCDYDDQLVDGVAELFKFRVAAVLRPKEHKGFTLPPRR
jgi:hypothetical protein